MAEAVNPAFVEPVPVVKTDLGHKRATYFNNWDFAIPFVCLLFFVFFFGYFKNLSIKGINE